MCIVVAPELFLPGKSGRTDSTVSIMSCETFAKELADLPSVSFKFKALNKERLIEDVQKALQVCSFANTVINMQNDIIMKHIKLMETSTSPMDDALAPAPGFASAPVSGPARASVPAFTNANRTFASIVKTTQPIIVKPSVIGVAVTSKEMMSKAKEALKKS